MHLIDNWRRIIHKLWSIRIALLWGVISGLYMALPAFQDTLKPTTFALLCVVASVLIVFARITKQPGIDV